MEWARQYKTVKRWLEDVATTGGGSENTQKVYVRALEEYCSFTGKNPDQLIEERKTQLKSDSDEDRRIAEETVKQFFLELEKKTKRSSAATFSAALRSFFRSNYQPLVMRSPMFVSEERLPISMEDLREVDRAVEDRTRFFIRFLKDSGISREDAVNVRYGKVRRQLEQGNDFIMLRMIRAKESVRYETFIGPDTIEALKTYLRVRRKRGEEITDDTFLFANLQGEQMSGIALYTLLKRRGQKLGIALGPHRLRKFFETRMALGKVHPMILRYWMGHKISGDVESHYVIPSEDEQTKLYTDSYKNIQLTPPALISREEIRGELLDILPDEYFKPLAEKYRKSIPEIRRILRLKKARRIPKEIPELKEAKNNQTQTNGGCQNGHNCQCIVSEEELPSLLAQGWRVSAVLPSGKIVVEL